MAVIVPEGWRELTATGAFQREIETLARLETGLPETYTVYHQVHWTRVQQGQTQLGEIDFVIVNRAGHLLLIEQKSGFLTETAEGLAKRYNQQEKHVASQMARSAQALRARLQTRLQQNRPPPLDSLLYCPDYQVRSPGTAGIPPERIVDARRRDALAAIIQQVLPDSEPPTEVSAAVHRFLRDELQLVPDVAAMAGQAHTLYTRLAGGLADWARALEFTPHRLRVIGTAGSGKTQLALALLHDTVAAGKRPLYVCYNRPLADHIARIAPPGAVVATYHQLADQLARAHGRLLDYTRPEAFAELEAFMHAHAPDAFFDALIVDEGQDFRPEWRDALLRLLAPEAAAWWLEDPLQNLYGRPPVGLPGWVTLRASTNYRSPRDILDLLRRLLGPTVAPALCSGSPLSGSEVEILTYADAAGLMDMTKTALTRALGAGFKKDLIALVTYRGRENSLFTPIDKLGPHFLRAFTGRYDLFGSPVYADGDLFIDSVHRFKGQSAPCVVFTEIDFVSLDDTALKKLFVGMTRASMKLILVLSERAAHALLARIGPG